jgi:hypothetical protein
MNNLFNRYSEFPKHHFAITPSDSVNISQGAVIVYCSAPGTASIVDTFGQAVTYTLAAGDVVPVLASRANLTGTTATLIGLY